MSNLVILVRIFVSVLLSGLVGFEREVHGRAAGLRTHILVCVGSTLFMITSILVALNYGSVGQVDPSRIAANVVTGIGFLGAGAIIRYGASIRGLTTAASVWAIAAIGLATGAGLYVAAGLTTIVVLAVLILSRLEERMDLKQPGRKLFVKIVLGSATEEKNIRKVVDAFDGRTTMCKTEVKEDENCTVLILDVLIERAYYRDIANEVSLLPGVKEVIWK
jgi:putative Mg2+ transporter-C (MgtC) family protein